MTADASSGLHADVELVVDTGPFLCLGGAKVLHDAFRLRCYGKTHWVQAVHDELAGHGRGTDAKATAARAFVPPRRSHWLPEPVTFGPPGSDPAVDRVLADVRGITAARRRAAGRPPASAPPRPGDDLGEAQSIVLASRTRRTLMSHDDGARIAARQARVPAVTLVDLARRLVADGQQRPAVLASAFQKLKQNGIEIGGVVNGPLDLTPRR